LNKKIANDRPVNAPVTIHDIARRAGVHYSTVSLALRGNPRIPAATRARIRRAADELGYHRDPVQLALTTRQAGNRVDPFRPRLVFLTNRRSPESFYDTAHMRSFLAGAREQAEAMGYGCDLMLVGDESITEEEIERRLDAVDVRGVILGAFMPEMRQVQLDWSRYAAVKIDSAFMAPSVALVTNDQMQAVRVAYRRLHQLGYRRIGLLLSHGDEENTSDLFSAGCLLEQELLALAPVPPLHYRYDDDIPSIVTRVARWVRRHRLDAVVSNLDSMNELLRLGGLRAPRDVAWACLSLNAPDSAMAGIVQNHHWVGRQAAAVLGLLLQGGQRGQPAAPTATYVECRWHDGSTAPRRQGRTP
jgi:LacI family transcriptional regulator